MDPSEFSNIGSKIRKERRAKGLSQSDLSKKLEISASYLNLLESGRRTITVPLLIKIGNELGISLKDLTVESNKRILSDIMDGGLSITNQAKIPILGGHTIKDPIPKYGLVVTGKVNKKNKQKVKRIIQ